MYTTPATSIHYRADLQGLRAVAILLVVIAHAELGIFPGGFIGVDIFFVLSGYLITGLLLREYEESGRIDLLRFYARRFKRLLPALLAMVCLVLVAATFMLSSYELGEQAASAAYASTWTSNLYFAFSTIEYFAELRTQDLFLHTWSLGVEEQFYIVWPISLLAILACLSSRRKKSENNYLLLAFGGIFLLGLGIAWALTITNPLWAFYLMPARIWQFALGASVYLWIARRDACQQAGSHYHKSGLWPSMLAILGLLFILVSAIRLHSGITYPGYWALFPSIGAALLIAGGGNIQGNLINKLLAHPIMTWIGDRSYSWYLWHWPILILGLPLISHNEITEKLSLVIFSLLLAIISYRYVELPAWKGRFSRVAPRPILLTSTLTMLMAVGFIQYSLVGQPDDQGTQEHVLFANAARSDMPVIYIHGCDSWFSTPEINPCIYGDPDAPRTAVMLGDSIGVQWVSALFELFPPPDWRVIVLTKSACPIIDEDFFYTRIGKVYAVCTMWRNSVMEYLASISPDIVFVGNSSAYDFTETQWIEGSRRILNALSGISQEVVLIPGTPRLSFDGPSCLARNRVLPNQLYGIDPPPCREAFVNEQHENVIAYTQKAAEQLPNVKLLNLNDLVCPENTCGSIATDGVVVFRDPSHLTDTFVRSRALDIADRLGALGLADHRE